MKEAERANLMWQIPFALLTVLEGKATNKNFEFQMRHFDHENINRFIGLSLDAPILTSVWKYCSRRSIKDVIQDDNLTMDAFFIYSLIKDIASVKLGFDNCKSDEMCAILKGICALHNSVLRYHGLLTSKRCLIDERWQLKISDYGLKKIRRNQSVNKNALPIYSLWITQKLHSFHSYLMWHTASKFILSEMLWMAPEILRSELHEGTQESDIYSFAIICSELIMRQSVWNIGSRKESAEGKLHEPTAINRSNMQNWNTCIGNDTAVVKEKITEIIYLVKRGGVNPMRPDLNLQRYQDLNPSMVHLVKECWNENPNERPRICAIISLLKSMNDRKCIIIGMYMLDVLEMSFRNTNLMDHVFAMLEQHAGTLEAEVEKRTKELIEEKKKSDVLLHRMLPKYVDFGTSRVVNLLNDLYTAFDGIIDTHDVYKVETIGDGYLCVSGLPKRNGNEHAREIANMSLAFMESLKHYRVPHMPDERINLRIGIHSGPCVAGVVGLTMPRYCLFGDTVNTASRMESSGKGDLLSYTSFENRSGQK
ncbi:unnamed protein product [Toxocara canis]|uniref:Guanylate cyclase n=1 Tax=Toxocara canis TaxID=6265 RepID=A0A183TV48_TOXCA|nr:unnamed protein product [Toxocara canis]